MVDPTPLSSVTYQWNTAGCYTHPNRNGGDPSCFPFGQTTQNVTDDDVTAEDAGEIYCTATINGVDYTSEPFTLRISGEQLVYCVISCVMHIVNNVCYHYLLHAIVAINTSCCVLKCIHCRYCTYWSNAWW